LFAQHKSCPKGERHETCRGRMQEVGGRLIR
jgi:hypothetical protein